MGKRWVYDYYSVRLPSDLFDDRQKFLDHAVDVARERAKLFVLPCEWAAVAMCEDGFDVLVVVRRKRHKPTKRRLHTVLVGTPSYMPDVCHYYRTLGAARDGARWQAQTYRDEWDDQNDCPMWRVSGNKFNGYDVLPRDADKAENALPTTIEVSYWDASKAEVADLVRSGELA